DDHGGDRVGIHVRILDDLVTVLMAHALAGPGRREAPTAPTRDRFVHVYRRVVDTRRLTRGRSLGEPFLRDIRQDGAVPQDLDVYPAAMKAEPCLGVVVPHLEAETLDHI